MTAVLEVVAPWIRARLKGSPLLVGLNGPQGCGKTTLCRELCRIFAAEGRRVAAVSIDDFYLSWKEQRALARAHPGEPCLQQRGYPGTHDVALGVQVLSGLKSGSPGRLELPRYDKSARDGEGDREPPERWGWAETPVELVLLEGWMLGFAPLGEEAAPELALADRRLARYSEWTALCDAFVVLEPLDHRFVLEWRVEAEATMRASGKPGMSPERVRAYVEKFLPAYRAYAGRVMPGFEPCLRLRIGRDRALADAGAGWR